MDGLPERGVAGSFSDDPAPSAAPLAVFGVAELAAGSGVAAVSREETNQQEWILLGKTG